jgi:hypothetical protein
MQGLDVLTNPNKMSGLGSAFQATSYYPQLKAFFNNFKTPVQSGGGGTIDPEVLNGKQDKFADIAERDGTVTVKSTVSNDRPPEFVFKNGVLELLAMHLQFGDGQGEVSLNGLNAPDDSLNISVNGNRIRNLADPIYDTDAVNKQYMDAAIGNIESTLDSIIAIQENLMGGDGE